MGRPYSERRKILDNLKLNGRLGRTPEAFDDGEALWEARFASSSSPRQLSVQVQIAEEAVRGKLTPVEAGISIPNAFSDRAFDAG
jgi:hypothetical protein